MLRDKILAGSLAGLAGTLVKALPNLVLWKAKLVPYLYFQIAASALILPKDVNTPLGIVVGILADLATGGTLGIIAIFLLLVFGTSNWFYKGLVFGAMVWLWGFGVAINLGTASINPSAPLFQVTALVDHLIFGLLTIYLIKKWYPLEYTTSDQRPGR